MKTTSVRNATALALAMCGFLLYVSLHAVVVRSAALVPGALLHLTAERAKGVVLLFADDARRREAAAYVRSLSTLRYAVLVLPEPPPHAAQLDAIAAQLTARVDVGAEAPVLVAIGAAASREAARLLDEGGAAHALVTIDYCPPAAGNMHAMPNPARAPWYALQHRSPACPASTLAAALSALPNSHLTWLTANAEAATGPPPEFGALLQWLDPAIVGQGRTSARLEGIPLVELPVANARRAVIFLSGDGGWAALDRGVAAALNAQGIAVVGWDSLSYFWQPRSPAVLARDLDRVIETFRARWHVSQVVVAGYSFGASSVPFAVNGLPAASRSMIEKVVLLGPTPTTSFEFRLSQWLSSDAADSAAVAPEVARLAPLPVWCVHGAEDSDAQCPPLRPPSQVITLPGNHHFDDDYVALARLIAAPPLMR